MCGAGGTAVVVVGATTTGSVVGGGVGRAVVVVVGTGMCKVVVVVGGNVVGGNVVDGASVGGVKRSGCASPSTGRTEGCADRPTEHPARSAMLANAKRPAHRFVADISYLVVLCRSGLEFPGRSGQMAAFAQANMRLRCVHVRPQHTTTEQWSSSWTITVPHSDARQTRTSERKCL
jgi:hypothetical protein